MWIQSSLILIAGLAMRPALAAAEVPSGSNRVLDEGIGLSINKLGLQHTLELRWTWPLTSSRNSLLASAHAAGGITHFITPSYTRLGAWVELSPLSVLDLRAGAEPGAYFGTFGSLQSFASYTDRFDDAARQAQATPARPGTGSRLYFSPTLKIRMGAFVAASGADLEWWRSSASGPLYYEPARDTLLNVGGDRLLSMSNVLLREHDLGGRGRISYGLGYWLTYVFAAPANTSGRIGVVVVRQFGARRFHLHAPRFASQVSYYLSDPSRKGQLTLGLGLAIGLKP